MRDAPLVAVIQFPGSNCEYETAAVLRRHGLDGRIYRWNLHREIASDAPQAFVLPGGFSFQDRVRAGAVGSRERIMDVVVHRASEGVPVLGICNGAQILVESGLVPGWDPGSVQASLAANHIQGRSGYLSRWVYVRRASGSGVPSPWLSMLGDGVIPIPIAHAEGRFVFSDDDPGRVAGCAALTYCSADGGEPHGYPDNPNGSTANLAGIMNPKGNVLAMMPHPERASLLWQVPLSTLGEWGSARAKLHGSAEHSAAPGPGSLFFRGLAGWLGLEGGPE